MRHSHWPADVTASAIQQLNLSTDHEIFYMGSQVTRPIDRETFCEEMETEGFDLEAAMDIIDIDMSISLPIGYACVGLRDSNGKDVWGICNFSHLGRK